MRYLLIGLAAVHGICHWAGYGLIRARGGEMAWAALWVGLGVGWLVVAGGIAMRAGWWLAVMSVLVVVSLVCCGVEWKEAKLGVLANLLVLGLACWVVAKPGEELPFRNAMLEQLWADESGERVRLRMRGEIKLGQWFPFEAEEVMHAGRGMVWAGTVSMMGLPVVGADEVLEGKGRMEWRLFGLIPVAKADGPDVDRSALGRFLGEVVAWMPGVKAKDFGEEVEVTTHRDAAGQVKAYSFPRWGDPDKQGHRLVEFGVVVEEWREMATKIRAGWFYGTERFESEGVFFRGEIVRTQKKP